MSFYSVRRVDVGLSVWAFSTFVLTASSAFATAYYWDGNAATAGFGTASGTWAAPTSGTAQGWSLNSAGTLALSGTVTVSTGDGEFFGTDTLGLGAGTVTISGQVNAGSMTFGAASGAIVLTGGQIFMGNSVISTNNASDTIASTIIDGNGLNKSGTGMLTLTASNSYSGLLTISAGSLQIGNGGSGASLGSAAGIVDNASLIFNHADNVTFSPVISGNGTLTKLGAGVLTLTGSNTYSSATTINGGTLAIGAAGVLGGGNYAGNISIGSGALFNYNSTAAQTFGGIISGSGGVMQSAGLLLLTGLETFTGPLFVNGGTLQISSTANNSYGVLGYSSSIVVNNGGTVAVGPGGDNTLEGFGGNSSAVLQINSGGLLITTGSSTNHLGTLVLAGGTLAAATANPTWGNWDLDQGLSTPGNGSTSYMSGGNAALSGSAGSVFNIGVGDTVIVSAALAHTVSAPDNGLIKSGSGLLSLTGSNTYSSNTAITAGTLSVGGSGSLGAGGVYSGNIAISSGALLNYNSSAAQTFGGAISGAGNLTQSGNSIMTLNGSNTYTGATAITAGTLVVGGSGSLGVNALYNGGIAISSSALFNYNSSAIETFNGVISGSGGLTQSGTSTLWLTNANNSFNGNMTINAGTLAVGGTGLIGGGNYAGNVAIGNGALLYYDSAAAQTFSGVISGSGSLTAFGNQLTLSGNNTYSGTTTVSAGTMQVPSGTLHPSYINVGGGTFAQSGGAITVTGAVNVGYHGLGIYALSGNGSLTAPNEYVGNGSAGTMTQSGGANTVAENLAVGAGANGQYTLSGNGSLIAQNDFVGYTSGGTMTQSGGTNNMMSSLFIGYDAPGVYTLSGSGSLIAPEEVVGDAGAGTMTQSGGTNNVPGVLYVGYGASGQYTLSGSGSLIVPDEYVGFSGGGTFTQSGGTHSVTGFLALGDYGTGVYNLNGGLLSIGGSGISVVPGFYTFNFGGGTLGASASWSSSLSITLTGSGGNATIDTTGGDIGLSGVLSGSGGLIKQGQGTLTLSASNTFTGTTTVSAGTLSMPSGQLQATTVTVAGGVFAQSGGMNNILGSDLNFNSLIVGQGAIAQYSLSGGTLNGNYYEALGKTSSGSLMQSGGVNSAFGLTVGYGAGGFYALSGGSLNVMSYEYVGYFGSGSMTQSGGVNSATGLAVGNAGVGLYAFTGGSLNMVYEYLGNGLSGTISQSGGTNTVTGYMGVGDGGNGQYTLSGNGLLTATNESVGYISGGTMTQSGGTNSVGSLTIAASSTGTGLYLLQNGYLASSNIYLNSGGSLNQSGGTLSATLNLSGGQYAFSGGSVIGNVVLIAGSIEPSGADFGNQATFTQSGGTISAGTLPISGTFTYSGGLFSGRLVDNGTVTLNSSFYAGQGIVNNSSITVPAGIAMGVNGGNASNTVDNEGTIILTGGTIAGGQTPLTGGPIVNNGFITGYGALTSGVGIANNNQITQSGGNFTIAGGTAGATNAGIITLQAGYQLLLSGSTLTNTQSINLNSATIAGSGLLDNPSGNISGPGVISAPFQNSGGILSVPQGTTSITRAFVNSGAIQLTGFAADLSGGAVTNFGDIQGSGAITNSCSNAGTIEAINGALTLSGSVQNGSAGLISASAGNKVLVLSGLASNFGIINLTGGIFDNNSHALANYGQISGYGTWHTGGLTNENQASIALAGATSTITGPVTNLSGGTISASYYPVILTGNVTNNGYFKVTGTTLTYAGSFINNGTYSSDPATNYFNGLTIGSAGLLEGGIGDHFSVAGPFTSAGQIDLGGTSTMIVGSLSQGFGTGGTGLLTQTGGELEMGTGATLTAGTVQINGGTLVADGSGATITSSLVYDSSAASSYEGMLAGSGKSIIVNNPNAMLTLSGSDTFSGGATVASGTLVLDGAASLLTGSSLTIGNGAGPGAVFSTPLAAAQSPVMNLTPVPEPGTFSMIAIAVVVVLSFSRYRRALARPPI